MMIVGYMSFFFIEIGKALRDVLLLCDDAVLFVVCVQSYTLHSNRMRDS